MRKKRGIRSSGLGAMGSFRFFTSFGRGFDATRLAAALHLSVNPVDTLRMRSTPIDRNAVREYGLKALP
jgi:hypothetical protein